jgi:tripartite-type tricarboxylate transporter receptor subunit TctC
MKKHRKAILFIAILALAIMPILAACGSTNSDTGSDEPSGSDTPDANTSNWPESNKAFTISLGYNPGGQIDACARASVSYFQEALGIPVTVENIPGSGGLVGYNTVFAKNNDGYEMMYTGQADGIWTHKYFSPADIPWSPSDWKVVGIFGSMAPMGLVVTKDSPYQDFGTLIEAAKTLPPKSITIASLGPGRMDDIWMIEIQQTFDIEFNWVFYDSANNIMTDLLSGDLDVGMMGVLRTDFLDHPDFNVICGIATEYPDGSPYKGVYPVLPDFEQSLGFNTEEDMPGIATPPFYAYIVKNDVPDEAYQGMVAKLKEVCENPEFQEAMKAYTWPTYVAPDEAQVIFDELDKTLAGYVELHSQYVK